MKKFLIAAAAAGAVTLSAAPAMAAPLPHSAPSAAAAYGMTYEAPTAHQYRRGYDNDWQRRGYDNNRYGNRGYNNQYNDRYDRRPVRGWNGQSWRGNDGRTYCRRDNGTTGLLIGGAVGALAGNEIAGRGDRTVGAIIGGIGGALLGRTIDRGGNNGYSCR
ncbi:glycine zipper 2TM domain-containing protein [Blastomonas sp.]|uniref:glycine zipper 2TM domain-containing protein n=1 Tax=Blastomonas sp. TaxID=1909299 RepID=UPI00260CD94C|nr:glycine zipper 2TM domain-containing protein [Blastomonas sp.]MDM7955441.1 glycine zipper 2TM domain-containing protein [Blastomonas sp.]